MTEQDSQQVDRGISVGGDVVGSALVTGDHNVVSVVNQSLSGKEAIEEADSLRNLRFLMSNVKSFWIDGVLEHSIDGDGRLEVGKASQPHSVQRPWEAVVDTPQGKSEVVAAGKRITDVFDDVGQMLLILGQPGSGKTTTLLELTRDLIQRAEHDSSLPVPVVLHLSSWQGPRDPLLTWIENELNGQYYVPRDVSRIWLQRKRLLLLLDGLDEVNVANHEHCIEAIHQFVQVVGVPGMVVCSRSEEYAAMPARLKLGGAVCLQPLTDEQIYASVANADNSDSPLRQLLEQHETLRQVAQSPLMLGIMSQAFQGDESSSISEASFESVDECHSHLFDAYIDRMFQSKQKAGDQFDREPTVTRLRWLAKNLIERRGSIFQIEDLQPDWSGSRIHRMTHMLTVCMVLGLMSGVVSVLFAFGTIPILDALELRVIDAGWLIVQFPIWFLMIAILDSRNLPFTPGSKFAPGSNSRAAMFRLGVSKSVLYFALWCIWPLAWLLSLQWRDSPANMKDWVSCNLLFGLLVSAFFGSIARDHRVTIDIRTVEALRVAVRKALQGGLWGIVVGLIVYVVYFCLAPPDCFPWFWQNDVELYSSITYPLIGAIAGLCIGGLVPCIIETKTRPNQGMRLSLRNALFTGLGIGIINGIFAFLLVLLMTWMTRKDYSLATCLWAGLGFGIFTGFHAGLWFGGLDVLKHALLRIQMAISGLIPRDFIGFLTHATRLKFLQRVGGGYIFVHGLLREHFSEMDCGQVDDGEKLSLDK